MDLPDFLGAGGRTLWNMRGDPAFYPLFSPLSSRFWSNSNLGLNITGAAYVMLLVLGMVSFVVAAIGTNRPNFAGLHPGRFALWSFMAFLSLLQFRLMCWFAIVAAPITVLNIVDWRAWYATVRPTPIDWRPARLGRVLTLVIFLALFLLGWPGWLHGGSGSHRVAWTLEPEPSLTKAQPLGV